MEKYNTIKGYMRNTHDKLPQILLDFAQLDGLWEQWDFQKFTDLLIHVFSGLKSGRFTADCLGHNCFKSTLKHHTSLCLSIISCRTTPAIQVKRKEHLVAYCHGQGK